MTQPDPTAPVPPHRPVQLVAEPELAPLLRVGGMLMLGLSCASLYIGQVAGTELPPWIAFAFYCLAVLLFLAGVRLLFCRRAAIVTAAAALLLFSAISAMLLVSVNIERAGLRLRGLVTTGSVCVVVMPLIAVGLIMTYRRKSAWIEQKPQPSKPGSSAPEEELDIQPGWDEAEDHR